MRISTKIFVDSDVIISSLLSQTGAAHLLVNGKGLELLVSDVSYKELRIVADRLNIEKRKLNTLIKSRFKIIELKEKVSQLKKQFLNYVSDPNDAHIMAGAVKAKANFLVTYNMKHFHFERLKQDFNIITLTPAQPVQYLRSKD